METRALGLVWAWLGLDVWWGPSFWEASLGGRQGGALTGGRSFPHPPTQAASCPQGLSLDLREGQVRLGTSFPKVLQEHFPLLPCEWALFCNGDEVGAQLLGGGGVALGC